MSQIDGYLRAFFLFVSLFFSNQSAFAAGKNSSSGFLDFNIYPYLSDVDSDSVFTLNTAAKLPNRLSYFSLINLINQKDADALEDTIAYYTEQNLRWQIREGSPLDLSLQLNFRSGSNNDRHRLGVRWRLNDTSYLKSLFSKWNLSYSITLHALQIDHQPERIWQLEHIFRKTFPKISDRLYVAGFFDQTFNDDLPDTFPKVPIIGEIQGGYRLYDNLFIVTEYRLNQFRRADVNNLAVGLEYKIIW